MTEQWNWKNPSCSSERDDLARANAFVGGEHDAQAVHRVVHVRGQIQVLADRAQQDTPARGRRAPGDRARPRC